MGAMASGEIRWRSDDELPGRRLQRFSQLNSEMHLPWAIEAYDLEQGGTAGLKALVKGKKHGDIIFSDCTYSPISCSRGTPEISSSSSDFIGMVYFSEGEAVLQQGGRRSLLQKGSVAFWGSSSVASMDVIQPARQLTIVLPKALARATFPRIDEALGAQILDSSPLYPALVQYLESLHGIIDAVPAERRLTLVQPAIALAEAAFSSMNEAWEGSRHARALLLRLQSYILEHLENPALTPSMVAEKCGISVRYLHSLFGRTGTTVARWIRARRLLAARDQLKASSGGCLSVTDIAMNNGFSDPSHFSSLFKREFGISPSAYRGLHRDRAVNWPKPN